MAQYRISIGVKVAPWVYRYLDMVKARALRTQQIPLLDIVELVCLRGIVLQVPGSDKPQRARLGMLGSPIWLP